MADFYRTAPIPETVFLMQAVAIPVQYDTPLLMGTSIFNSLVAIVFAAEQFKLRRRLENSVSEHGYTDKAFKTTIPAWCDRQTARVVAKNCGSLDDYVALCDTTEGRKSFQKLGHL